MTDEQLAFIDHEAGTFLQACPGAGKTRAIIGRVMRLAGQLPERQGVALLSFTNRSVEELGRKAAAQDATRHLRHPGYYGTFDSFVRGFIFAPFPVTGVAGKIHVVDSWETLDAVVRLRGRGGVGVCLDAFNPITNAMDFAKVDRPGLRAAQASQVEYERAAAAMRGRYRVRGYFSAADARQIALQRIRDDHFGDALGRAVAARFPEVIVDEAQDCNPEDLEILSWMRRNGVRVTMVCDLDQSIFEFRDGARAHIEQFLATYPEGDRLRLTGNFRSSPSVCHLAASLRSNHVPDDALGDHRNVTGPILIKTYSGRGPDSSLSAWFVTEAAHIGLNASSLMVLAHVEKTAMLAAGGRNAGGGLSRIERLARAVAHMGRGTTGHARTQALRSTERLLLEISGRIQADETVSEAIERLGLNSREVRRQALECLTCLPGACADNDGAREAWIASAREVIRALVPIPQGTSVGQALSTPARPDWCRHLRCEPEVATELPFSTIHNAKGGQYGGVLVVMQADGKGRRSSELLEAWAQRTDHEPKRVIYVGVTRAERLLALAVPENMLGKCVEILDAAQVRYAVAE